MKDNKKQNYFKWAYTKWYFWLAFILYFLNNQWMNLNIWDSSKAEFIGLIGGQFIKFNIWCLIFYFFYKKGLKK